VRYRILTPMLCVCLLTGQAQDSPRKRDQKLRKELASPYPDWIKGDVAYIITDDEHKGFTRLSNDEEREQFVEQFWLRRDPTPDTEENEYKEEHYRRIAYANERFASGVPGWKTDRGRIYIQHGPPDEIESHPSGGTYQRPIEEGGGQTSIYPFEKWRYRHLDGVGDDVMIEFVDSSGSGEFRISIDPSEKDALQHLPSSFPQPSNIGAAPLPASMNAFNRIEQLSNELKPPPIKFKDLEAAVSSSIRFNTLPMRLRTDFIPLTPTSVLTYITVQLDRKDLQFEQKDGVARAAVNLYGRISTLANRKVNVFEDAVSVTTPSSLLESAMSSSSIYQKTVPLNPGRYRLNFVAKDLIGGHMATQEIVVEVPAFEEDKLSSSSLILADLLERVSAKDVGSGQFVIADSKVRPRIGAFFHTAEKLGIYIQLFHFALDSETQKPRGSITYDIGGQIHFTEDLSALRGSASQLTLERQLPLQNFSPGNYMAFRSCPYLCSTKPLPVQHQAVTSVAPSSYLSSTKNYLRSTKSFRVSGVWHECRTAICSTKMLCPRSLSE
jgi:GWxTD domain-containing protein